MLDPMVLGIAGWLAGAVLCALVADAKGLSAWAALAAALILSPVLAYLYLLAVPAQRPRETLEDITSGRD